MMSKSTRRKRPGSQPCDDKHTFLLSLLIILLQQRLTPRTDRCQMVKVFLCDLPTASWISPFYQDQELMAAAQGKASRSKFRRGQRHWPSLAALYAQNTLRAARIANGQQRWTKKSQTIEDILRHRWDSEYRNPDFVQVLGCFRSC